MWKVYLSNVDSTITLDTVLDFVNFFSECYQLGLSNLAFYKPTALTSVPSKNAVATSEDSLIVECQSSSETTREATLGYFDGQLIGALPVVASAFKPASLAKYTKFAVVETGSIKSLEGDIRPSEPATQPEPVLPILQAATRILATSSDQVADELVKIKTEYEQMRSYTYNQLDHKCPRSDGGLLQAENLLKTCKVHSQIMSHQRALLRRRLEMRVRTKTPIHPH